MRKKIVFIMLIPTLLLFGCLSQEETAIKLSEDSISGYNPPSIFTPLSKESNIQKIDIIEDYHNNSRTDNIYKYPTNLYLRGKINILIFEVKPFDFFNREEIECCYNSGCTSVDPSLYDPLICEKHNIISFFNRDKGSDGNPSVKDIKKWYETQAKNYNITDLDITVEIAGPYIIDTRLEYGFDPNLEVINFFNNLLVEKNYSRKDYDFVHYVYFDDFGINKNTKVNGFRSFALKGSRETFNSISYGPQAIKTIMHEMGHEFNGDDLYSEKGWGCQIPEGIPEPQKEPLFPQEKACLMCGTIMTSNTSSKNVNYIFKELIICDYTARKFGWKK